jgi:hypothetical protein
VSRHDEAKRLVASFVRARYPVLPTRYEPNIRLFLAAKGYTSLEGRRAVAELRRRDILAWRRGRGYYLLER